MNKIYLLPFAVMLWVSPAEAQFVSPIQSGDCSAGDFVTGYSTTGARQCDTPAGGSPGGSTGDIQYNNAGAFGGRAPSGNGTSVATTTGAQTSGRCVEIDANGNHIAAAAGCATSTSVGFAPVSWIPGTDVNNAIVFVAPAALTITGIRARIVAAVGTTATISVIKAASGTACTTGAGTNLIAASGTVDANTASTTNQTVTLAGGGAPSLSAGDTACLQTANGASFLAGNGAGNITIAYTVP
jgi:hypothetical protein